MAASSSWLDWRRDSNAAASAASVDRSAGLAPFAFQPRHVGQQGPRRLHRLERGQALAPLAGIDARSGGKRQCAVRLRFGGAQLVEFAMPAQLRFQRGMAHIERGLRDLGGGALAVQLRPFSRAQRRVIRQLGLQHACFGLLGLVALERAARDLRVDGGAGQGLEQFAALVLIGFEKRREFVLGQQHGTCKLLERQADARRDLQRRFGIGAAQRRQFG
jgi:hypothetical protein